MLSLTHFVLGSLGGRVEKFVDESVCAGGGKGWIGLWPNFAIPLSFSIVPIALITPMLKTGAPSRPEHSVFVVIKHGYLYTLITFLS